MRRVAALLFALAALLFHLPHAHACVNAVLGDETNRQKLRLANEELDEGDVAGARKLAMEVAGRTTDDGVRRQAQRTVALSFIRDRSATTDDIERETEVLRDMLGAREGSDPALQAELGEAYARAGNDEAAYQTLSTLDAKDLMGSPYAYAALARVAAKRGDAATASRAAKRCAEITTSTSICRGEYPSPPLLRGTILGYGLPGAFALVALVRRRRAKHPWSAYGDKLLAAIIVATCAFVFAYARSPITTASVTFAMLALLGVAQRVAFLTAVKRERVAGFVLRDASAEDGGVPAVASFLHSNARVLEHVPDATYREPARVAVLRLTPRRRGALAVAILGAFVLALFAGCSLLTMRTAKHESATVSRG